ncbi:radical SAM protein [Hydrogenobacter hydrogenophilus]|nr:radical SAM protein [Hydrogenobacter hydrogenophilus]
MRLISALRSELNELFIFELEDGNRVEAVFYRGDTLCVSTQVGCAIRCPFCLSGSNGLVRNLTSEEIYKQYDLLKDSFPIKRIAIAGIGEPLMNYQNVVESFWKFKKAGLKVSFYTTGFPYKYLKDLLRLPHNGLTVSIHSTKSDKRKILVPHGGDIDALIDTLREELASMSKAKKKKISLAYLLIKGVNDSYEDLDSFAKLVSELGVGATLLYYNTTGSFEPLSEKEYEEKFLFLKRYGIRVTLSTRFRKDPLGGCGTLIVNRN